MENLMCYTCLSVNGWYGGLLLDRNLRCRGYWLGCLSIPLLTLRSLRLLLRLGLRCAHVIAKYHHSQKGSCYLSEPSEASEKHEGTGDET